MQETLLLIATGTGIVIVGLLVVLLSRINGLKLSEVTTALGNLERNQERVERSLKDELLRGREEAGITARALREEVQSSIGNFNGFVLKRLNEGTELQLRQLESFARQLQGLAQLTEQKLEEMRRTLERQMKALQEDNSVKLEQMRATVDEKLHATLEQRLGESFRLVSERLELVHKGLGEMQALATGVGDLKRVLTNVKTRGIWGEIHLGNLLEQILAPEQYDQNVVTKPGSRDRVEFAIRLPGRDQEGNVVWLPIDAKFPQEDYQRLLIAQEEANPTAVEEASKALEARIKGEARSIAEKYLCPPFTTEFGILFLPIEGLYAEVLRRPGLSEELMRVHRIVVCGPTTLAAFLNSLQMGFRTLAVEKRSSEVWKLLGAVKTEFGNFGTILEKTQKKLQEASNSIDSAARKSRTIERKLRDVQELPPGEAANLLGDEAFEDTGLGAVTG